ncbi:MAG: ABC transporter permease [Bacteroidota bacterium]
MRLIDIALRNIGRQKGKTAFLVLGLAIAVSTVVTLHSVSERMNAEVSASLDDFGANILILPKSDDLALSYGGMSVSDVAFDVRTLREKDIPLIRTIKNSDNISIVAPKLITAADLWGVRTLVVGVDFSQEKRLKRWWSVRGAFPDKPTEALVGSDVSAKFGLTLNRRMRLAGMDFVVSGILEPTGSQDDGLVFIDLRGAQFIFDKPDQISLIEVAARCYDCPIDELVRQISAALPAAKVTAIKQAIESKMEAMHRFEAFSFGVSGIVLVIGLLVVFANMTASVNQRTREIGIFRAIGYRQRNVITIILTEALVIGTLGGLVGFLVGSAASTLVSPVFGLKEAGGLVAGPVLGLSVALAVLVGLAGSIYPAVKASRLDPDAALRAL